MIGWGRAGRLGQRLVFVGRLKDLHSLNVATFEHGHLRVAVDHFGAGVHTAGCVVAGCSTVP